MICREVVIDFVELLFDLCHYFIEMYRNIKYNNYSTDHGKVNSPVRDGNPVPRDGKFLPRDGIPVPWDEKSIPRDSFFPWMDFPPNENH